MKPIFMRQPKDSQADHRRNGGNRNWDRFVTHVGHGHPAILPTIRRIPDKNFNRIYIFGSKINLLPET